MAIRIPWNKFEAVVLLKAYLEVKQGNISRREAISMVSKKLRQKALLAGLEIDDIFRNENGISMQLSLMESLLEQKKIRLHKASKLFEEIVDLFQNNPSKISELLQEAEKYDISGNEKLKDQIFQFLDVTYVNGIVKGSQIEWNRFRRRFKELHEGKEIPKSIDLESLVSERAIEYNNRYYVISDIAKEQLIKVVDDLIGSGQKIFYYEELYERYVDFFEENHIFTADVLRLLLKKISPNFEYHKHYFVTEKKVRIEKEIRQLFSKSTCITYEQVKEKMPYISMKKIKQVLNSQEEFIWVRGNVYTTKDQIVLNETEVSMVKKLIETEVEEKGFSSMANQNFEVSVSLNPQLSEYAVREAFFQTYMSDCYDRRGNILYFKGRSLNVNELLRAFCSGKKEITIAQLNKYETEITGCHHGRGISAAYDTMVRVDKEKFVCTDALAFDIAQTDWALSLFAMDNVIPLKAVTSFTSFPYIKGYGWNLYLLESFCRNYSKKYRFQSLFVNSKNVGAIYPANRNYNEYTDVMAEVVMKANIPLSFEDVGSFLCDNGYVARRTVAIGDVITRVQAMANQGG